MAWTDPVDPVGGTVITVAAYVSSALNPIRWLRLLTGNADPPGSSYVVVSTSTVGTSWQKVPTDAIADGAITAVKLALGAAAANIGTGGVSAGMLAAGAALTNLGYTPLSNAGGNVSGAITENVNTGAVDASLYTRAGLGLHTTDGSRPALAFIRDGTGALALYFEGGLTLKLEASGGTSATLWSDANDGAGSGLDADTVDALESTALLARANHTGTQLAATISDLTTAVSGMAAASAATASDSSKLGGVLPAGYKPVGSGSGQNTSTVTFTGSPVTLTSTTAPSAGTYAVFGVAYGAAVAGDVINLRLNYGGTLIPPSGAVPLNIAGETSRKCGVVMGIVTSTNGQTIALEAYRTGSATNSVDFSQIMIIKLTN